MGGSSLSSSNCATVKTKDVFMDREVFLNVYDLTPFNSYSIWFGFGIFHTGIEVYGMEYAFGAHDYSISGVFEVEPRTCPGFIYRCSISLGHISMSASDFREFIESRANDYHGSICSCLLPESIEATTVKPLPESYTYEDDISDSESDSSQEASETDEFDHKVLLSPSRLKQLL